VVAFGVVDEVFFPELGDLSPDPLAMGSDRRSLVCKNAVIGWVDRMCGFAETSPTSSAFKRRHNSSRSFSLPFSLKIRICKMDRKVVTVVFPFCSSRLARQITFRSFP
jgi:hypothetical protein